MVRGEPEQFDLVIVGGGMVGASLAAALDQLPLRVAMVEAFAPDSDSQPSYDERCTAVAHGSKVILDTIGVWQEMQEGASAIDSIHVSDQGRPGIARISANQQGVPALGYVIPNRCIGRALWRHLESQERLSTFMPCTVVSVDQAPDGLRIELCEADGGVKSIGARLLVAVDGARSAIREMAGIEAEILDYDQTAIICNLTPTLAHQGRAFERFTDDGPLALLPLGPDRCSVVWTVKRDDAVSVMAMNEQEFSDALQRKFGFRLGRFRKVGERSAYPLFRVRALQQTANRLVLLGNAAHSLHPVAGQGFNLSLRDVAALAEVLAQVGDGDPGDPAVLEQYLAWRLEDQEKVLGFTDALVRLFTSPFAPLRAARNAGLVSFDLVPGLKRLFARHTMGRAGRLPRLARGVRLL